jgi:hypothetical protein
VSAAGLQFLENWLEDHVLSQPLDELAGEAPALLAQQCIDDAQRMGIAVVEMEEEVGSLEAFIAQALNREVEGGEVDDHE